MIIESEILKVLRNFIIIYANAYDEISLTQIFIRKTWRLSKMLSVWSIFKTMKKANAVPQPYLKIISWKLETIVVTFSLW